MVTFVLDNFMHVLRPFFVFKLWVSVNDVILALINKFLEFIIAERIKGSKKVHIGH
jgi:hypothetical protein